MGIHHSPIPNPGSHSPVKVPPSTDDGAVALNIPLSSSPPEEESTNVGSNNYTRSNSLVSYSPWQNIQVRHGFLRKVYGILSTQLILTFGITLLFILNENIKLYIQTHPWLLYTAVGLSIVVLFTLTCFESIRRKHPTGLILLGLFTLCEAYVIGCISSFFDIDDVIIAIGITATIIIALTLFAFQTKIDFTVYTGVLLCITVGLLIFGFLQIWFRSQILHILYATLGAIVFSCYLVIDTQSLLGNKRLTIGIDDAIFAALQLYLDIINIFLFILQLCGGRNE